MPANKVLDNNALLAIRDYIDGLIEDLPSPPAKRYMHNVRVYNSSSGYHLSFNFVNTSSTALTYSTLSKALYDAGFSGYSKICPANGFSLSTTSMRAIIGVYGASASGSTTLNYRYVELASMNTSTQTATLKAALADSYTSMTLGSGWTIQDTVTYVVW